MIRNRGSARGRIRRGTAAALLTGALALAPLVAAPAAQAAVGVIEDPGLAACINRSIGGGRDDAEPITEQDLAGLRMQFQCIDGPAIRSFAGFEGATNTLRLTVVGSAHEFTTPAALASLGSLPKLGTVSFTNVQLTDAGLAGLASATNLHTLDITNSPALTSTAPLAGMSKLTKLTLTELPALTDLAGLAGLTGLTQLDLSQDGALSDLGPLAGLTGLLSLTLQFTAVNDLSPLAELRALRSLSITNAPVTSLEPLANMRDLSQLWATRTAISSLAGLEDLSELSHVWLSNTQLTGGIDALANKPKLQLLDIRNTRTVSLEALAASTALTSLDAVDNRIPSLVGLREADATTSLHVSQQNLTGPTQYVPRDATSFVLDASGQLALRDGTTFPELRETSFPPTGPEPAPELPLLRFTRLAEPEFLQYSFGDGTGFNEFAGRMTLPVVLSEVTSADRADARAAEPFTHQVTVTEGFPATRFALDAEAPAWLTIDPATGLLRGTPDAAGEFSVGLTAADALGNTVTQRFTVTVSAAQVAASTVQIGPDQRARAGSTLTFTVTRDSASERRAAGGASVTVSTADGTARAGTDYTAVTETLVWEAGDTAPRQVTVRTAPAPAGAEPDSRQFTLTLSSPGEHTALGERHTATGTIAIEATEPSRPDPEPKPGPDPKPGPGTPQQPAPGGLAATGQPASGILWAASAAAAGLGAALLLIRRRETATADRT